MPLLFKDSLRDCVECIYEVFLVDIESCAGAYLHDLESTKEPRKDVRNGLRGFGGVFTFAEFDLEVLSHDIN